MTTEEFQTEVNEIRPTLAEQAKRYLSDAEKAEDTVQDVLLRLWQMHDKLHKPIAGLASILIRNLCIDQLRRHKMPIRLEDYQSENAINEHEQIDRMMKIVEKLPDIQQTILRLRHMEGMKIKNIAGLTSMSEVAIRKTLSRARIAVREKYLQIIRTDMD
ncbi:MAG: sigma-70 family RNA polymerase sigma factor [Prevotella sp.]|nr:sigma-70 family RNA polymerase sigma factor [Prevotella sp.]